MNANDKCPPCSSTETEISMKANQYLAFQKFAECNDPKAGFEKYSTVHICVGLNFNAHTLSRVASGLGCLNQINFGLKYGLLWIGRRK